jgi:hypothetical protein
MPDIDPEDNITPAYEPYEPDSSMPEVNNWDSDAYEKYIAAEVMLPKNNQEVLGRVVGRKHDANGNPIGKLHSNQIMDTRIYQVVFPDGETAEYSANVIAECI